MTKVAFILAGGASRGAYQAGCLKRLEEEGITPDLIIGSSIGVCNSLVWAMTLRLPCLFRPQRADPSEKRV